MYQIAHFIIKYFPSLWDIVEFFNEKLFLVRYGRRLKNVHDCLEKNQGEYIIKEASLEGLSSLVIFLIDSHNHPTSFFNLTVLMSRV